jgi:serine/threonine-protein kinase
MSASRDQRRQLYEKLVGQPVARGKYQITDLLGFGGMGAVYEAIQKNMDRKVALKLIPTHDPTIVARFEREALTISKLQHPNTITVFDFGQSDDGFLFLSMELLQGQTLTEVIEEGPISAERAVHIGSQICRSLAEAHKSGIVHRDVKPDNIILIQVDDDPDVVKVLDFGIAKAVMGEDDVQLTGDGRIIGTPRYMSPEQILAEPLDHRSDIYSLGCILFEMLCGAPPFQQSSTTALMISHTQDPPPPFAQQLDSGLMAQMPPGVERVVRKALSKHPEDRHQDCDALREELEAALEGVLAPGYDDDDAARTAAARPPRRATPAGEPRRGSTHGTTPPAALPSEPSKSGGTIALVGAIALLGLLIGGLLLYGALDEKASGNESKTVVVTPPKQPEQSGGSESVKTKLEEETATETTEEKAEDGPKMVRIRIESDPTGAKLFEGKAYLGDTPMSIPVKAELNKLEYRLVKDGYEELTVSIPVDPERTEVTRSYQLDRKEVARKRPRPRSKPKAEKKPPPTEAAEEQATDEESTEPKKPKVDLLTDEPKANVGILDD